MSAPLKVIDGHLTATEKRHIAQIVAAGAYDGSTPLKRYLIEPISTTRVDVTIWSRFRLWVGDDVKWHKSHAVVEL